jgi:hypothetical protein
LTNPSESLLTYSRIASGEWSPDDSKILVELGGGTNSNLYWLDIGTKIYEPFTSYYGAERIGDWHPDPNDHRIAFGSTGGNGIDCSASYLHILEYDPLNYSVIEEKAITDENGNKILGGCNHGVSWSPDGEKLLFIDYPTQSLVTVNIDGTGKEILREFPHGVYLGGWSPDGSWVTFCAGTPEFPYSSEGFEIFVMPVDTSLGIDPINISNLPGADCIPKWGNINSPPEIFVDEAILTISEGETALNNGDVIDPDGDPITLTASIGTATNHGDETWSWSYKTNDGPAETQTVTVVADDGNGGVAEVNFELVVNNVRPTVHSITVPIDPIPIGQPASADATFSDPAGDYDKPYTCTVNYRDSTGEHQGVVNEYLCVGPAHYYTQPGIYRPIVTVTDKDGDPGYLEAPDMIVVYDPDGGFVTGGGWIWSSPGAYKPDTTLEGKANFGFVSKYKKGASIPTGNTEFQFKAGDLNFHSSSYDWLVVTGSDYARFKGSGTINGDLAPNGEEYKFMIWAGDGDPDTFRIKIWYEVDGVETVVYDNGTDQEIGGGNIVVHTKK